MSLGWVPVNGSFAVAVFVFVFFSCPGVCIFVASSVLVGGDGWRGRWGRFF